MKTFTFHEGSLLSHFTPDFEPALFNLADFRLMQDGRNWLSFFILNERLGKVMASLHLYREGDSVRSPYKAPYGSIECSEKISPAMLFDFLTFVESRLKVAGVEEILIKNPPRAYAPEYLSLLETFLLNHRYEVADAEVGAIMTVDERPFLKRIRHSEMLRYKQALHAELLCREIGDENIEEVYNFIARCHAEKRYPVSISCEALKKSVEKFPGRYISFGVFDGDQMCAASVSIRVKTNILYNFLINHERMFNALSPPILLMEGLYNYCHDNGIPLLDLGTSALHGRPNHSLLDFKLHIGGTPTSKLSFYKKIG